MYSIITLARSGATERAWQMFREAGLDRATNDPAALSIKGRLLKDRAIAARGAERRDNYRAAAEAYGRAAKLSGTSYPLINAATLSLLGGNTAQARRLARQILARRDDEMETPYWKAATRAEAHLLLGEIADAKVALTRALSRAPRAYEDHASTLRQLGLILAAQRADDTWLDALRPPRCLHFAGSMGLRADSSSVTNEICAFIARQRIGFGFGALAAGADLIIAEALLAEGAELHVYLPGSADAFRKTSVSPYGGNWPKRFDAVLENATDVHFVGEEAGSVLGVRLAAEVAMGNAALQARLFTTDAVQLLLLGRGEGARGGISRSIASVWKGSGRRQQIITAAAKNVSAPTGLSRKETGPLAATLCIQLDANAGQDKLLREIAKLLSRGEAPLLRPRWTGEGVLVAFTSPDVACRKAQAIARMASADDLRVGGDYSIVRTAPDPFGNGTLLTSASVRIPQDIARSAPAGAIHVSESFAASLFAGSARVPRVEIVGELAPGSDGQATKLFALRP